MLYKSLKDTKLRITPTCFGSYVIHHQAVPAYRTHTHRHTHTTGPKLRCQTPTKHTTKYL